MVSRPHALPGGLGSSRAEESVIVRLEGMLVIVRIRTA